MVEDLIFEENNRNQSVLAGVGISDAHHLADVLRMAKGWNKFHPEIGVDIQRYLHSADSFLTRRKFEKEVQKNLSLDTAKVREVDASEGIQNAKIHAEYSPFGE